MLVKKCYGDHKKRQKKRNWHLQQLDKELVEEVDSEEYERDMTVLMEDLVEDKSYRQNINIFLGTCACTCVVILIQHMHMYPDMMYM